MNNKWLYILVLLVVAWYLFEYEPKTELGPGVKAPRQPQQQSIRGAKSFQHNGYEITPLAEFDIEAKVLAKKTYLLGRESELSPVDFAMGWGVMSDEAVLKEIKISQSNRFYWWRTETFPVKRREIETSSANMHIVPANANVKSLLKNVQVGQIVHLKGKLIKVQAKDGWHWRSSLTRDDTGNGACELIWTEKIDIRS